MNKKMKEQIKIIENNTAYIFLNYKFIIKNLKYIIYLFNEKMGKKTTRKYHKTIINNAIDLFVYSDFVNTIDDMTLAEYKDTKEALDYIEEDTTLICAMALTLQFDTIQNIYDNIIEPSKVLKETKTLSESIAACNNVIKKLDFIKRIKIKRIYRREIIRYLPGKSKGPEYIGCTKESVKYLKDMQNRLNDFHELLYKIIN